MKLKNLLENNGSAGLMSINLKTIAQTAGRSAGGNLADWKKIYEWPDSVASFYAYGVALTNIHGSPINVLETFKIIGDSMGSDQIKKNKITSLEGGPRSVNLYLATGNLLTDLQGAPDLCMDFNCRKNNITTLKGIGKDFLKTCKKFRCDENDIKENVLGLMLVKDLETIYAEREPNILDWKSIIQDHLDGDRDLLDCQEDLISQGYKEYAKL